MKALRFSPAAISDISAIWEYTAQQWGPDQADHYVDDIRDLCLALAAGHKTGRPLDLRPGYRQHPVASHLVFYRETGDQLHVIRILHNRMDFARHL